MFDGRQAAALVAIVGGLLVSLAVPTSRATLVGIGRKVPIEILVAATGFAAFMSVEILAAEHLGLWDSSLLGDTIFWVPTGVLLLGRAAMAAKEPRLLRRAIAAAISLPVYIEALSSLGVFGFWIEIVLLPAFILVAGLSAFVGTEPSEGRLTSWLLIVVGLLLAARVTYVVIDRWSDLDWGHLARVLLLSTGLTVGAQPYLALLAIWSSYSAVNSRVSHAAEGRGRLDRLVPMLAVAWSFGPRWGELSKLSWRATRELGLADSWADARSAIRRDKAANSAARDREQAYEERLHRHAGVEGSDPEGGRLDRREFRQTVAALRYLQGCQAGRYWNRGERYSTDLLSEVSNTKEIRALPDEHGIQLAVSEDGQSWFAWRRTPSGWVLGIGDVGLPHGRWEYDAPDPPKSFPQSGNGWVDIFVDDQSPNWMNP